MSCLNGHALIYSWLLQKYIIAERLSVRQLILHHRLELRIYIYIYIYMSCLGMLLDLDTPLYVL